MIELAKVGEVKMGQGERTYPTKQGPLLNGLFLYVCSHPRGNAALPRGPPEAQVAGGWV